MTFIPQSRSRGGCQAPRRLTLDFICSTLRGAHPNSSGLPNTLGPIPVTSQSHGDGHGMLA